MIFWIFVGIAILFGLLILAVNTMYHLPIEALRSGIDAFMGLDILAGLVLMCLSAVATVLLARRFGAVPTWLMIALPVATVVVLAGTMHYANRPVSVDNPVGTLRFDELSSALVADPDREIERIVGDVWRLEGPKRTWRTESGMYRFFVVDLDTNDGFDDSLFLDFVDDADELRFETEEVPIACLITGVNVKYFDPVVNLLGRHSIFANSCRVVEPDTKPATDSP